MTSHEDVAVATAGVNAAIGSASVIGNREWARRAPGCTEEASGRWGRGVEALRFCVSDRGIRDSRGTY